MTRVDCLATAVNPLPHVMDVPWVQFGHGGLFDSFTILSNHIIMMILAASLMCAFLPRCVRMPMVEDEIDRLTPRGYRNGIETICEFLRNFVAKPNLGPYTDRFVPYLWSTFFFILTCNLLGLLPLEQITRPFMKMFGLHHGVSGAATGNIFVTATLAICTFVMIVANGFKLHGTNYVKHFFMGPFPINCLIGVLEMIGVLVKCAALAIRLFANMMAGHILLAVLVGFIAMAGAAGPVLGLAVAVPVVVGSIAITLLELFVAFLQAFIFTFLTAVFIGLAVNIHTENENENDNDRNEAVAHAHE